MKFKLIIRLMERNEISRDCHFPPEEDDFHMYSTGLIEDLLNINEVKTAIRKDDNLSIIYIELEDALNEIQLKEKMKPIFSHFFCLIRFVSLDII